MDPGGSFWGLREALGGPRGLLECSWGTLWDPLFSNGSLGGPLRCLGGVLEVLLVAFRAEIPTKNIRLFQVE